MVTRLTCAFAPSGRRESNPHDQLGRLVQAHFVTIAFVPKSCSEAILTAR